MTASKRDVHLALGLPDPGDTEDSSETSDESSSDDQEQAENDAIDAVFDTKDPDERREAFRTAVKLCSKSY